MGMYTELVFKADMKNNLPIKVKKVLEYLFNYGEEPNELPDHALFKTPRWACIGSSCSFYHVPWASSRYENDYIFSRSDLKNYDDELELFIDWVTPYIEGYLEHGEELCVGWTWFEESTSPKLIMIKGE